MIESLYLSIFNFFLVVIAIGAIWTVAAAILPDGQFSLGQRLGMSTLRHILFLAPLAVALWASYFVYVHFYPDTYECDLTNGSVVIVSSNLDQGWIEVEGATIPASRVVECRPLVTSMSQRFERALENAQD